MERLSKVTFIPAVICFVVLFWKGEYIRDYSVFLYIAMMAIIGLGMIVNFIQNDRNKNKRIAEMAVEKYKKNNGISD